MPPAFALSQDQTLRFIPKSAQLTSGQNQPAIQTNPDHEHDPVSRPGRSLTEPVTLTSVSVTHQKDNAANTPVKAPTQIDRTKSNLPNPNQTKTQSCPPRKS